MASFQHPASLNLFGQFSQACSILNTTSRADNPAWYQEALTLNLQLHIRPDGPQIPAFFFDRKKNQWFPGPVLTDEIIEEPSKLEPLLAEILRQVRSQGATSLGVILHVADEFATTELKPELDNPAALPELRDAAIHDPASILQDSSILPSQASWRVLPYPASGSEVIGTTVTLTRQHEAFLSALRMAGESANFPVITHAVSAPLLAVMGLCESLEPTPDKPFVAILQYPWFTCLAFFNEHADLRLIRTLQHRGVRRPTNFHNALNATNASLEFVDPDLFLIQLGQNIDTTLEANLRVTFTGSRTEVIRLRQMDGVPDWCPEPLIATVPGGPEPKIQSETFTILRDEEWALQDFLPAPREIVEIFPTHSEMRLLRVLRLARVAVFVITVVYIAYSVLGIVNLLRSKEWSFDSNQSDAVKSTLAKLSSEKKRGDYWNNLIDDRSKAWVAMESFLRMFPENKGMLVRGFSHTARPDSAMGQAKVGFVKEWRITGFARDEALEYLNTLNSREGIQAHFSEIARVTGNPAFNPAVGNRSITVNIRTQENGAYKPIPPEEAVPSDDHTYPYTFELTLNQRFEATDPLAINVPKAP